MSYPFDKAGFVASLYKRLSACASLQDDHETDGMRLLQLLAGVTVEVILLFDEPDLGLDATVSQLSDMLGTQPYDGPVARTALPPPYVIDYETELGRAVGREMFEEWLNCAYQFHDLLLFAIHHTILRLEVAGKQRREETLRIFSECTVRCLSFEIAAQELCDIVIENKVVQEGWRLRDGVSALSAVAGRSLALSHDACELFSSPALPDKLDHVAYVMTQEAVRLGVPAGTDWRFGLAANDYPTNAPYDLIYGLEPYCRSLFRAIEMNDLLDQSVACAKAAGRMLAVTAGGENPELEPVIAKPLAMAAIIETYRTVCRAGVVASL